MSEIIISPYLLTRIGGETFETTKIISNKSQILVKYQQQLYELNLLKEELRFALSSDLYTLIGEVKSEQNKDNLKKIRRNLYNDKEIKGKDLLIINSNAPKEVLKKIKKYLKTIHTIQIKRQKIEASYISCDKSSKIQFLNALSKNKAIAKGLILSSRILLNDYNKLVNHAKADLIEDSNTENGLMKYFTRTTTKTSPFSTFTNIGLSITDNSINSLDKVESKNNRVRSNVRLNSSILKYIKCLIESNDLIFPLITIRLNPTLKEHEDCFKLVANSENKEAVQKIEKSQILIAIISYFKLSKISLNYSRIYNYMASVTDAQEQEIRSFINMLLDVGLLDFYWGVSANDPLWPLKFTKELKRYNKKLNGLLDELIATLLELNKACSYYAKSDLENRIIIIDRTFNNFRNCCKNLHISAKRPDNELISFEDQAKYLQIKKNENKVIDLLNEPSNNSEEEKNKSFTKINQTWFHFKPEQMFYEDSVRNPIFKFNKTELSKLIQEIDQALLSINMFELFKDSRKEIRAFYLENYRTNKEIPVIQFYEDHLKHIHKLNADKKKLKSNSRKVRTEIQLLKSEWLKTFIKVLFKKNNLNLDRIIINNDILKEVNNTMNIDPIPESTSFGMFFQSFYDNGKLKMVINEVVPGYGKFFGRFLHLLNPVVQKDLKALNLEMSLPNVINAELSDASHFNVNMHPPLLDYEITSSGGNGVNMESEKILVSDVSVRDNSEESTLELIHNKTRKKIVTFDLSFQNLSGRSQLFQMLNSFTDLKYQRFDILTSTITNNFITKHKDAKSILHIPRIYLGENIILQRRTWKIPFELVPIRKKGASIYEYFIEINNWRLKNNIPNEVFISIKGRDEKIIRAEGRIRYKDHKPQYIDFNNTILLRMFEKDVSKTQKELTIYEMLPSSESMFRINNKRYVTEFIAQWYKGNFKK